MRNFVFALLMISFVLNNCSSSPTEESVIASILDNDPESVIDGFFEKEKLEVEQFKRVVGEYSDFITSNDLNISQEVVGQGVLKLVVYTCVKKERE